MTFSISTDAYVILSRMDLDAYASNAICYVVESEGLASLSQDKRELRTKSLGWRGPPWAFAALVVGPEAAQ